MGEEGNRDFPTESIQVAEGVSPLAAVKLAFWKTVWTLLKRPGASSPYSWRLPPGQDLFRKDDFVLVTVAKIWKQTHLPKNR